MVRLCGDQLVRGGEIDAVKTGMADRRAADAQVNLFRAGAAKGAHLGARRRAAHDGIFDDDDAAIFHQAGR